MHESTLHRWKRQGRTELGLVSGVSLCEGAQLKAARRRIWELEAELVAAKRASGPPCGPTPGVDMRVIVYGACTPQSAWSHR